MSDPYGGKGSDDRGFHEQETTAQPAVDPYAPTPYPGQPADPYAQQGQSAYGQQGYPQPNYYGQQPYGQQVPYGAPGLPPYAGYQPKPTNGLALASMITSIAGIFVLCGFSGIVAVILGVMGLKRSKEMQGIGRGQAITGIIIGAIQFVLAILVVIAIVAIGMFGAASSSGA